MVKLRILLSVLLCGFLCVGCSFESVEEHNNREKTVPVSLEIRCDTVWDNLDLLPQELQDSLPADGVLLARLDIMVAEGTTPFELLRIVCTEQKLTLGSSGTGKSIYVKEIAGLKEFSVGPLSGWQYYLNGSYAQMSCSDYTLQPGDQVLFAYTCALGKDLEQ